MLRVCIGGSDVEIKTEPDSDDLCDNPQPMTDMSDVLGMLYYWCSCVRQ